MELSVVVVVDGLHANDRADLCSVTELFRLRDTITKTAVRKAEKMT
jgi:hypothetical protein